MSNETSTTETITYPKATLQTPPALVKKIGNHILLRLTVSNH